MIILLGRWGGILFGPIALIFGLMMAFFGYWRWSQASELAAHGQIAHATVSASHDVVEDGDPATYVTLAYVVNGETVQREERIGRGLYDGDGTIDVVYDPAHPHEHMVVGTQVSAGDINSQIGMGVVIALFGVIAFVVGIRAVRS